MSEQLHVAAERARLERRRRLVREVAPYLAPGERVLEATTGKGPVHAHGTRPRDVASLRVVVTDQRLILLRKKAFRQFAVQAFSYETSHVSLGFTAEAGGELRVADASDDVRVSGIPELDLEPLFLGLRDRMEDERLDVWLDEPDQPEAEHPLRLPELDELPELGGPADAGPTIDLEDREPEPIRVGAATIDEILAAAGFPPEPGDSPSVPPEYRGIAEPEDPPAWGGGGSDSGGAAGFEPPSEPALDVPLIIPDPEREPDPEQAAGSAQSGILRWLMASTGAQAALYLRRTAGGDEHLQVEPRRLEARLAMSLVRLATDAAAGPESREQSGEQGTLVTRWGEAGEERALVLSGLPAGVGGDVTAFARFVLDRLDASASWAERGREQHVERPELLEVEVSIDDDGRPVASVRLAWKGGELSGRGHGHTAVLGRHLAVARAVADALRPMVRGDVVVEHLLLTYPPMDAELVVATVLVGARRFVGATASAPGGEDSVAARAVLDALNRNLGQIT